MCKHLYKNKMTMITCIISPVPIYNSKRIEGIGILLEVLGYLEKYKGS